LNWKVEVKHSYTIRAGVWIQEVAKLVPDTAELIGVDIETGLVPRAPSLPPNLQFQRQSVLDLPQEWTNKFDVVHQRLLLLGLREGEWRTALSEIYRVLKPGGWFQLFEIDEWEQSGPELTKFCNLFTLLSAARGIHGFWPLGAEKWQKYVAEAGFGDLQVSWHYSPMGKWAGEEGLLGQENRLSLLSGCKKPIVDAGGFGIISGAKEFDNLLAKVEKEFDAQKTRNRYIMICGRKPM
jgi:SAM-dependent methyltransferase